MFAKLAIFVASVAVFAAASPLPGGSASSVHNSCNTGSVQCCNSMHSADDKSVTGIAALLGVALGQATGQVGLSCSPLSVLAIAGNSCSSQPVCCSDNNFNGVIAMGCSPVNANL